MHRGARGNAPFKRAGQASLLFKSLMTCDATPSIGYASADIIEINEQ
jgi:hypothetical protein